MTEFDAIIVGSGISGGWVAKELAEQGLKILLLERGREIVPERDYTDMLDPWEKPHFDRVPEDELQRDYPVQGDVYAFHNSTKHFWVKDHEHPYDVADGTRYVWRRGYHLGGRSIMWGRLTYRLSPVDFEANKRDGHGVDWPIRYGDLAPWYDKVETFAGISGSKEGLLSIPDGQFLPPFELTAAEIELKRRLQTFYPHRTLVPGRVANLRQAETVHTDLGRGQCQARNQCYNGCSFGAYFSSLSATLPAAQRTGNLTLVTDAIVHSVDYDAKTRRVTGVRVIDAKTKISRSYRGKMVFLNASTINTAVILLNSRSEVFPDGLANRSGQVGRNLMDHVSGARVTGIIAGGDLADRYYSGRRPNVGYIPRYANMTEDDSRFKRGFAFQVYTSRDGWSGNKPGLGAAFKESNRFPGAWRITLDCFGEVLPDPDNRVALHPTQADHWGIPIPVLDAKMGPNEWAIVRAAADDAAEMLTKAGLTDIVRPDSADVRPTPPGDRIHEMGTARMGRDPETSVLNGWNQAHDIDNLFITDGSCMTSSAVQNPSLTYMALSARAAHHAVELLKEGKFS
jgi:choline dehydrogenase-like flavoprotein